MKWLRRIVVHLCAVMLVTPIGWCCWLPTTHAEEAAPETQSCCGTTKAKPVKQDESPAPTRSCCCDPQPALSSEQDAKAPAVAVDFVAPTPILLAMASAAFFVQTASQHDPSLALHVLHCRWLC